MIYFCRYQRNFTADTDSTSDLSWRQCGQNLARFANKNQKYPPMSAASNNSGGQSSAYVVGGRNASSTARRISTGRRHSVGAGSPDFRLVSAAAGNQRRNAAIDRKFVVSDLLTIVTLAGAYYCINKLKSILI